VTLHIREAEVRELLTMPMAIEAVEEVSRRLSTGEAIVHARRRIELPGGGFFHYMAAADFSAGYLGMKLYTYVRGKLRFVVPLYRIETGEMAALIEADVMGQLRTGAASGVATKYMGRPEARVAAVVGTGGQARTQLAAVAAVRKLTEARAYGRNTERLGEFCREMCEQLGIPVHAAASSEEAVRGVDIVCTATTASHAVVNGAHLSPGTHINAIGANHAHKRELDGETVARAHTIITDSIEQAKQEAGDLILGFAADESRWGAVRELHDIVSGKAPGRASASEISLFKSNGIAIWDVGVAVRVLRLAQERKMGELLPLWGDQA